MIIKLSHKFEDFISVNNLLEAYVEFTKGKMTKNDVLEFSFNLMDNLFMLRDDLVNHTYKHGLYQEFKINDPKSRIIHKATVRDRILHRAVYRLLYPYFDKKFIADSFSCRNKKGTHKAIERFAEFGRKVSKNNTKQCHILKCDIKKFFHSINQEVLLKILEKHINDKDIFNLLREIIASFNSGKSGTGLPLGNLTSQLFANVYLNELDQFAKHKLKAKYYIRYTDDFVILSQDRNYLENLIPIISDFLQNELKLSLHSNKVFIGRLNMGVDFLGWINFSDYKVLRTKTKNRILKRISRGLGIEIVNSYLGLLKHGKAGKIRKKLLKILTN